MLLGAASKESGANRVSVIEAVVRRIDPSQRQASEAYDLAKRHETSPRSIWGYVQGLMHLSQRTSWQDGRFRLDRAASRLLATVN